MNFLKNIVDTKDDQQTIFGIQPKNQIALKVYIYLLVIGGMGVFLGITFFIVSMIENVPSLIRKISSLGYYYILLFGLVLILIAFITKMLFLTKPPFDDWVYEISAQGLGTKVIFYTRKKLYIQFNRTLRNVDFDDFILKMAERSEKYSYFIIKKYIDEGFLEVETTVKQQLPTMVPKRDEDDSVPNFIPLGLALNPITKRLETIGWFINTENKVPNVIQTLPSVSIAIAGSTGCFSKGYPIRQKDIITVKEDEN